MLDTHFILKNNRYVSSSVVPMICMHFLGEGPNSSLPIVYFFLLLIMSLRCGIFASWFGDLSSICFDINFIFRKCFPHFPIFSAIEE